MSYQDVIDAVRTALFGWTLTAASSELGKDQVQTADSPPDGQKQNTQRPVIRTEPFGVRSRPPNNIRALTLRLGASNVFAIGYSVGSKYGPGDLEVGETAIYCQVNDVVVKLDKDGAITIAAASNQNVDLTGQVVNVNGSVYSLLKTETFLTALKGLTDVLSGPDPIVNTSTGGVETILQTPASALSTAIGLGTYKSTKAKNG